MSCGRNRRRPKLSSTKHSQLHNHYESSPVNTQSSAKIQHLSRSRKSNRPKNLSKHTLHENTIDFDRFRILDDKGIDVTPQLITDYVRINIKKRHEDETSMIELVSKQIIENQEPSLSEKSIVGTTKLSNSISNMVRASTLFSAGDKTTFDIGTRLILESEQILNKTQYERSSHTNSQNQQIQAQFLPGVGLKTIDSTTDNILLTETETNFILDLDSNIVSQEDIDEYNKISYRNKTYVELCRNRQGNDLYIECGMQTFNDLFKHEHIITDPVLIRTEQSSANAWDIYDSTIEANQYEGKIYRQYLIHNNGNSNENNVKSDDYQNSNIAGKAIKDDISKRSSSQNSSAFLSEDSLIKMTSHGTNCFESNDNKKTKLPDIDVDPFIMERILNSTMSYTTINNSQESLYPLIGKVSLKLTPLDHGISTIEDKDNESVNKKDSLFIKNSNMVRLERLWQYTSHLSYKRNVSCLCLNEQNHNLLAVGYGKFQYNADKEGLVCCWNAKNPEFPERYYQTDAGVTSLAFSKTHSNLLAIGLFNGNICIFDLTQNNTLPVVNTNYDKKHIGPVWQLAWNERDHSSVIDNNEVLISISSDGRIIQWILRKELEATDLMHLKLYNLSETICQPLHQSNGRYINRHFSNLTDGLCFDIQPNDKTLYLCGTDDGYIHRCSIIYNEKYLETYIGHTAPVYKIHWSPFVENIFLSTSADWTIRLWMIEYNQTSMIFSSTNSNMFLDAIWSPKSATMFFSLTENTLEIWDLSISTLDPIYITNCSNQSKLTSMVYNTDTDCILVGTNDGTVLIYHLENFPSSTNANDLITIVQQSLLNQLDAIEKTNIHQETSLISTQTSSINNDITV